MAAMLAATACSSDGDDGNRPVPIVLTSTIGTTPTSRAAQSNLQSTQIVAGDGNVGVWIVKDTNDEAVLYANKAYSADGSGKLNTDENPYFPVDGSLVKIYAYAPRQESGIGLTSGTFTVPPVQTSNDAYIAADLLIGAPVNNHINMGQPVVNISFNHKMAKIVLDFTAVTDDAIIGSRISTCGLYASAEYNLQTGIVTADETTVATTFITEIDSEKKAVLLLPPQTVEAGNRLFGINYNGTMLYYAPNTTQFDSGKVYTYDMKVDMTKHQLELSGCCSITTWGSGNAGSGHIVVNQ